MYRCTINSCKLIHTLARYSICIRLETGKIIQQRIVQIIGHYTPVLLTRRASILTVLDAIENREISS